MAEEKGLSRRTLLRGAGYSLAGLTLAGTVGMLLPGCGTDEGTAAENGEVAAAKWPLNYAKLDPDEAAQRGYDAYWEDG
ncbi:hypothetical protein [Dethiobacter alkaliphilus]|uniref:Uncharacterized protein n=1 Tax=Dethiobacter alkaliphilus AHT 1 TaxID=555088 RepID=C0GEZ4_DETAL|nr:hypothetical protein [Dethiobacter alkaliphilus]EEG78176.1 conserved hypothetical protein [Dethiobacter alkaliphilus AHT 1]MCW3491383.1 hypothetical protein [Dethiobacter alkaliphilus]